MIPLQIKSTAGVTLPELLISLALFGIISVCIYQAFHTNSKAISLAKVNFDNQTNAKGALHQMVYEIRNCRDLYMPSDTTAWSRDNEVYSPFLSFQKYKNNSFSAEYSTVTYKVEQDKLYRYEDFSPGKKTKHLILDNLLAGTSPFYLPLGDVAINRKIKISLTMKNFSTFATHQFSTDVFVQNPPAIGDHIYNLP